MNSIKLYKKIYKLTNIMTAGLTVFLLLCFSSSFDAENGYLIVSPLTIIFTAVYVAGLSIAIISVLLQSEFEILKTPNELSESNRSFYLMGCLASIFSGILGFVATNDEKSSKMLVLTGVGMIFFGLYIAIILSKSGYSFGILKLIFLFLSIAVPLSFTLTNNSNYTYHINSIENKLTVMFSIFFLMHILFEAKRICLGHHSSWHMASMFLVSISGLSLSGAYILAFITDMVAEGYRFYHMLVILIVSLFVNIELRHILSTLAPKSKRVWMPKSNPSKEEAPSEPLNNDTADSATTNNSNQDTTQNPWGDY